MKRSFLYCFFVAFTIVGSIIGAGFITGKEVYEFFAKDFSLSGIYITFLCFSFMLYVVMTFDFQSAMGKSVELFVVFANVVVAGCMISALDSVYIRVFNLSEKVKLFSIISTILLFFISLKGISYVEKFCTLTLPIMIVIIMVLGFKKVDDYVFLQVPKTYGGVIKPIIYVGFNTILSASVIKNSGEKLSPLFKIVASCITSLLICSCISVISLAVQKEGKYSEMPFISLYYNNRKLLKIIDIITLFAICSTLISALYTIGSFAGFKVKLRYKILLIVGAICVSEIGFSSIVERLYPQLGILTYALFIINYLLLAIFPKERRERTLPRRVCIK